MENAFADNSIFKKITNIAAYVIKTTNARNVHHKHIAYNAILIGTGY